jgi:hypothetical protein
MVTSVVVDSISTSVASVITITISISVTPR